MKTVRLYLLTCIAGAICSACSSKPAEPGAIPGFRSVEPVEVAVPTVKVDSVTEEKTFYITPLNENIRVNLSDGKGDTMLSDTAELADFINLNMPQAKDCRILIISRKDVLPEKYKGVLEILRKTGLNKVNFVSLPVR